MHGPLNVKCVNSLWDKLQSLLVLQRVFYNYFYAVCVIFQDGNKGFVLNILPRQYPSSPVRNDQRTNRRNVIEISMFPLGQIWFY